MMLAHWPPEFKRPQEFWLDTCVTGKQSVTQRMVGHRTRVPHWQPPPRDKATRALAARELVG
jgi:hypothetical protein